MSLCGEMIYLVRLQVQDQRHQIAGVDDVPIMKEEATVFAIVRITIKMIDAHGIESAGAPD